ncbi:MAG: T9SS type A sorting domain-containing protein [Bacteroidales bacterium]|nr:T9SS type A sorting domain-containing protein [Bacteroidales bacterium]
MKLKILHVSFLLSIVPVSLLAQDWQSLTPPNSPSPREGHSMVTIPEGKILLFGGGVPGQDLFNDLFVFEQNDWNEITPENAPPPARMEHEAWISGDKMYIYGGLGESGPLDDMWTYDLSLNRWEQPSLPGGRPPARYGQAIVTLPEGSMGILGGTGSDGYNLNDFWSFSSAGYTKLRDCPKSYSHHLAFTIEDQMMLVFGEPEVMVYYQIEDGTWGVTTGGLPLQGYTSHVHVLNNLNEKVVFIFGGRDAQGEDSDLVYEFNTATGDVIQRQQLLPQPVAGGDAALYKESGGDSLRNTTLAETYKVLIFGGESGDSVMNQTWVSTQSYPIAAINLQPADGLDIVLYPNPANSFISLQLAVGSWQSPTELEIVDVSGIQVMKELIPSENPKVTYDISHLPQGVYFCRISNGSQSTVRKLVVIKD